MKRLEGYEYLKLKVQMEKEDILKLIDKHFKSSSSSRKRLRSCSPHQSTSQDIATPFSICDHDDTVDTPRIVVSHQFRQTYLSP